MSDQTLSGLHPRFQTGHTRRVVVADEVDVDQAVIDEVEEAWRRNCSDALKGLAAALSTASVETGRWCSRCLRRVVAGQPCAACAQPSPEEP